MSKKIVYVCEKPSITELFSSYAEQAHPLDEVYFINQFNLGFYHFQYPRGLKHSDFPHLATVKMKLNDSQDQEPFASLTKILVFSQREQAYLKNNPIQQMIEVLQSADQIIFACDGDYSSVVAFHHLLKETLGEEKALLSHQAIVLQVLTAQGIQHAVNRGLTTHDDWYVSAREYGLAKQYFDYNFNLNSYAVFGDALAQVGFDRVQVHLSKYLLQVLYFMARHEGEFKREAELYIRMSEWVGTGKYGPSANGTLGSVISRTEIIMRVSELGLIENRDHSLFLSAQAKALLSYLHPDCCDLDLPFRIYDWCQDFEQSKPKMDRYLRTLFGKQKRFFAKRVNALNGK